MIPVRRGDLWFFPTSPFDTLLRHKGLTSDIHPLFRVEMHNTVEFAQSRLGLRWDSMRGHCIPECGIRWAVRDATQTNSDGPQLSKIPLIHPATSNQGNRFLSLRFECTITWIYTMETRHFSPVFHGETLPWSLVRWSGFQSTKLDAVLCCSACALWKNKMLCVSRCHALKVPKYQRKIWLRLKTSQCSS